MPLSVGKPILKASLITYLTQVDANENEDKTPEQVIEEFADALSDMIDTFVRSGLVTTAGSSTNQTGGIT